MTDRKVDFMKKTSMEIKEVLPKPQTKPPKPNVKVIKELIPPKNFSFEDLLLFFILLLLIQEGVEDEFLIIMIMLLIIT